ncbi:hypothetical protein SASPL_127178 [Salvia splendens]|uniref:Uncharacterized protein n=1 Tax=Salvia splendens TaxID=180675 RepID=A0A8X8XI97_SALSN|nr:hypothetical protein SASPL_127178 [Salvia splendens]
MNQEFPRVLLGGRDVGFARASIATSFSRPFTRTSANSDQNQVLIDVEPEIYSNGEDAGGDCGYSRPFLFLDMIWNLAFVVVSVLVLLVTLFHAFEVVGFWLRSAVPSACGFSLTIATVAYAMTIGDGASENDIRSLPKYIYRPQDIEGEFQNEKKQEVDLTALEGDSFSMAELVLHPEDSVRMLHMPFEVCRRSRAMHPSLQPPFPPQVHHEVAPYQCNVPSLQVQYSQRRHIGLTNPDLILTLSSNFTGSPKKDQQNKFLLICQLLYIGKKVNPVKM